MHNAAQAAELRGDGCDRSVDVGAHARVHHAVVNALAAAQRIERIEHLLLGRPDRRAAGEDDIGGAGAGQDFPGKQQPERAHAAGDEVHPIVPERRGRLVLAVQGRQGLQGPQFLEPAQVAGAFFILDHGIGIAIRLGRQNGAQGCGIAGGIGQHQLSAQARVFLSHAGQQSGQAVERKVFGVRRQHQLDQHRQLGLAFGDGLDPADAIKQRLSVARGQVIPGAGVDARAVDLVTGQRGRVDARHCAQPHVALAEACRAHACAGAAGRQRRLPPRRRRMQAAGDRRCGTGVHAGREPEHLNPHIARFVAQVDIEFDDGRVRARPFRMAHPREHVLVAAAKQAQRLERERDRRLRIARAAFEHQSHAGLDRAVKHARMEHILAGAVVEHVGKADLDQHLVFAAAHGSYALVGRPELDAHGGDARVQRLRLQARALHARGQYRKLVPGRRRQCRKQRAALEVHHVVGAEHFEVDTVAVFLHRVQGQGDVAVLRKQHRLDPGHVAQLETGCRVAPRQRQARRGPRHFEVGHAGKDFPAVDAMVAQEEFVPTETGRVALLRQVRGILMQQRVNCSRARQRGAARKLGDQSQRLLLGKALAFEFGYDVLDEIDHWLLNIWMVDMG